MSIRSFVLILTAIVSSSGLPTPVKPDWKYIIEQYTWNSTNENIIAASLLPVRVTRGKYGLTGTIKFGQPIDDSYTVEIRIYSSASGNSQYKMMPLRIPKSSFYVYMNRFYKKFVMDDVKNCSDLPIFEDEFNEPVQPTVFHLDSCVVSTDKMPTIVWGGYYKVELIAEGPAVRVVAVIISKVY